jgi:hypothetical protein
MLGIIYYINILEKHAIITRKGKGCEGQTYVH